MVVRIFLFSPTKPTRTVRTASHAPTRCWKLNGQQPDFVRNVVHLGWKLRRTTKLHDDNITPTQARSSETAKTHTHTKKENAAEILVARLRLELLP